MSEERSPIELAVELFVYAPLGLAMSARELVPKLVERGRQQVEGQVSMARVIGQFAVKQGSTEAGKAFSRAREQAEVTLEQLGVLGSDERGVVEHRSSSVVNGRAPVGGSEPELAGADGALVDAGPAPEAAALAIPDYDSLSASQVVPRLSGLLADELAAVGSYEGANRGRKTILNRVRQLQQA